MPPIVETRSGKVEGAVEDDVQVFRGIPYAKPPVDALRFAAPEREEPWRGVLEAKAFGASAPQRPAMLPLPGMDVGAMDEDCLFLNVFTPAADQAKRPVMVWIHGGGFVIGSASQTLYGGAPITARGDVVLVTINYRLGPLGFLHLGDLCPDLPGAVANAGIRDQVAALEWVRENISSFGGNPDDVTIFGESAGGMSVGTLLGMPSARGLFHRAIPQSGAAHNAHTRETATEVARQFLADVGFSPADAHKLREVPPDKLLDIQQQTVLKLGSTAGLLPFQPAVDGDSLPEPAIDAVTAGSAAGVDLLTGTTRDEWRLFGMLDPEVAKLDLAGLVRRLADQVGGAAAAAEVVDVYRRHREPSGNASPQDLYFAIETDRVFRIPALRLIDAQRAHCEAAFLYQFTWASPAMGGALGACHAIELPFVFGQTRAEGAEFFIGTGPEADALAEVTMDAWTAFARSGDPSHPGLPGGRWPAYDDARRSTMCLGAESICEVDPEDPERAVWDEIL